MRKYCCPSTMSRDMATIYKVIYLVLNHIIILLDLSGMSCPFLYAIS